MSDILDQLFPAVPPGTPRRQVASPGVRGIAVDASMRDAGGHRPARTVDNMKTVWAAVYTLELRGLSQKQIAAALNMSTSHVSTIICDERYIEYRERHLSALDQEFVAMKPLAFAALKNGLTSQDENTALRASEQWLKGANYGGFSKHERPATTATAEDIARQLLAGIQVNVQVNTGAGEARSATAEMPATDEHDE